MICQLGKFELDSGLSENETATFGRKGFRKVPAKEEGSGIVPEISVGAVIKFCPPNGRPLGVAPPPI